MTHPRFALAFWLVITAIFLSHSLVAQTVIFSEDFTTEFNGNTSGTSAEGYNWNTNCPACVPPADIFETLNGQLRGADTNGPAYFTSTGIDATGCLLLTFQFDYNSTGYTNNLECADDCVFNGNTCTGQVEDALSNMECNNCWDFLAWEINSGSVTDNEVVLGLDCNAAAGGMVESNPLCLNQPGADPSNVNLTITMSMWATNEWMEIDNVTILCYTEAEAIDNGVPIPPGCTPSCSIDIDDVITTDPTCDNTMDGEIEIDATGTDLTGSLEYSIDNGSTFQSSNVFPNLGEGTYDIIVQDDQDPSCFATATVTLTAPPAPIATPPSPVIICYSFSPPQGEVLNLDDIIDELTNFDPSLTVNWFFDMAGNNPLDPTDSGDLFTLVNNGQTTVYASVSDGVCESNIVPVSLDLNTYPAASDGSLTECRGPSGDADFTLSDADTQFTLGDPDLTVSYHDTPGDADTGDNPVTGTVSTPNDQTLYVRIENSAGCASTAELELIVTDGTMAEDASLDACDDGSGQATFDLTSLESTILNGQSGTVTFYENMAATIEILNPGNYTSGPDVVYAVVEDAAGCFSAPSEITLNVISIDPNDVFLSFDPTSGCGNTAVSMTLNTPAFPAGDYTFNVSFGPVSAGPVSTGDFIGVDGETPFTIGINEDYVFVLNSVTGPGPDFCEIIFSPAIEYIIPISNAPDAFPASIIACPNGLGEGTFDLTTLENTINGNTGFPVDFYQDMGLNTLINNPTSYISGPGTIFAVVDAGGGCVSEPVAISLFVEEAPDPVDFSLDITSSCTATDVTLTFDLPNGDDYSFDLLLTDANGTTVSSYNGIVNLSMLTFNVSETTTFSIDEIQSSFGCFYTLSPGPSQTITIGATGATPDPASLEACDNGTGTANFDLTLADNTVNGGNGETVVWFEDMAASMPIADPTNYTSASGTVYAALDIGGCLTETVAVMLTVFDQPEVSITLDEPLECAGDMDAAITVNVVGNGPFQFDWNDDTYDGQQTLTGLAAGFYAVTVTDDNDCEAFADITISAPTPLQLECRANMAGQGSGENSYTFIYSGGTPFYILDLAGPVNITFTENMAGEWDSAVLPPGDYTFTLTDDNGCTESCTFTIVENCDLTLALDGTDPSCAGEDSGALNLVINSSQPIILVDWNDDNLDGQTTPTNVGAGTYTVTVVDDLGCTEMASFTLNDPPAYDLNCAAVNLPSGPGTSDGSLTISVNDGPGDPYTVTYDNGMGTSGTITESPANTFTQTNLPPGDYQITITNADNCTASCSVDLQVPPCTLMLSQNGMPPTCSDSADGTATVVTNDGTAPFTYDWSDDTYDGMNTATGLSAGQTLSVTVTDMLGCIGTINFLVPTPAAITLDCSNTTNPSNAGATDGQADLAIGGGSAPYTISWTGPINGMGNLMMAGNFQLTGLSVGTYTVTVEDNNGCTTSCTFTLSAAGCDLTLDLQGTNPDCAGAATGNLELLIDGSFAIATIDWNDDNLDGIEDPMNVPAGFYEVTVTDVQGCVATTSLTLTDPPALFLNCSQTTSPSTNLSTDGEVDVVIAGGSPAYTISWMGPVSGSMMANTPGTYNINGLSVGSYTVTIEDSNGCTETCTFVLIEVGACTFDLTINTTDETCPGEMDGTAAAVPGGGTPPYMYTWSTTETTDMIGGLAPDDYTVTVTDANNCIAIANFTIGTANALPTLVAGNGAAICADSCYSLPLTLSGQAPFTVDYTLNSGGMMSSQQLSLNNAQDSIIICPAADGIPEGNFSITFTQIADANCSAPLAETVAFEYLPPAIGTFMSTICPEDSITVGTEVFHAANPTGTVILPNAASTGCDSTVNVTIDFFAPSIFDLSTTICPEDTLSVGGVDFHINNPTGQVILDNASVNGCDSTVNVNLNFFPESTFLLAMTVCSNDTVTVGTDDYYFGNASGTSILTDASANGCDSIVNVDLSFFPESSFTLNPTICNDDTITVGTDLYHFGNPSGMTILEDAATNGCDSTVLVDLQFFPASENNIVGELCQGDTLNIAGQDFFSGALSGTIVLENASANGCDSTIFVNLTELLPATENFTADLCAGDTVIVGNIIFTEDALEGIVTLQNQAANGCDSIIFVDLNLIPLVPEMLTTTLCPGESLSVGDSTFTMAGAYEVLLQDAAASGCDSLVQVDLSYYPAAEGMLNETYCAGESVTIGGQTFDINNSSGTVILPNASANGCDSTLLVDLTFLPGGINNLDSLLCFGESLSIGGQTFNATNPGGIVVLPGASANGCDSTIFVTTTYRPELFASLGPDTTLCGNQTVDGVLDLSAGATYDFSIVASTGFTLTVDDVNAGQYTFGLGTINQDITLTLTEITTNDGCAVTVLDDEAVIRYSDAQINLTSIGGGAGGTDLSCANANDGSIQAVITGGVGPFEYNWNTGDDSAIIDNLPPGTYTLTVTDQPGCITEATLTLSAPPALTAAVVGASSDCFGASTGSLLLTDIQGGTGPYEYSLDNEFFTQVNTDSLTIGNLTPGSYTVYLQDANDCQISLMTGVPEATELQLEIGDDEVIQFGDSILLNPQFDFTPASWTWTPTEGLSQPDTFITYVSPLETTIYQLVMTDLNGCSVSDIIRITVERELNVFIPSVFSPDADGTNDVFMIFAGQGVEEVERFQIFDRWGNQVFFKGPFQPNDPQYGWDGTHNGELMNAAVFVYFAEVRLVTGEVVLLEGDVVLLR